MVKFTEIIQKILFSDNMMYYKLPKEINEKIIINFKESINNKKENNNLKIHINDLSNYFKLDKIKIVNYLTFFIQHY